MVGWWWLIVVFFIGMGVGLFGLGLASAAHDADEWMDKWGPGHK